jgi:aminoglycoside/choline kinase family phosphotransferase
VDACVNPVDIEGVSAAWLTEALGIEVRSCSAEKVGAGQTGATYRLTLDADGVPPTLIAKVAAGDAAARERVAPGYRNEVGFYAHLVDTLDVRTPRCWCAAISDDARRFTLLLEDLAPRAPGVQADGCTVARARGAVANLVGLHAPRWNDATLLDLGFLVGPTPEGAAFLGDVTKSAVEVFVDRYGPDLEAEEVDTLRASGEAMASWVLARPEPFSVVHGDYRLDNLMLGEDPDDVVAVDWQTLAVGPPARDVAYFLATCLDVDDRRACEAEVVAGYHAALLSRGVEGYDAARCFEDYRLGLFQAPFITCLGAAFATAERSESADRMFLAMARRACAAIADLRPFDLL